MKAVSPEPGPARHQPQQRFLRLLPWLLLGLAIASGGQGVWIHAKAWLAQQLLEQAWNTTLSSGQPTPPWPWADTYPIARLSMTDDHGSDAIDLIVLAGDSGRTLAFGPGHSSGSALPGGVGTSIISGHRDTHFRFLQQLRRGDTVQLTNRHGRHSYRVRSSRIVDSRHTQLYDDGSGQHLTLVTCYPFDAIQSGGPLRYVVEADAVPLSI